jgi:hypothetical protein
MDFRRFFYSLLLSHRGTLGHEVRDFIGAECVA